MAATLEDSYPFSSPSPLSAFSPPFIHLLPMFHSLFSLICLSIVAFLAILRRFLVPKPLPGIPYNVISSCMPWGDLANLGIYNWRTGEVFSWFSLQCLRHKSPIVQVFIPSFSMVRPTLLVADLREIEDIVTRRIHEIDRAPMMRDFFGLMVPRCTIVMPTSDQFKQQRRLWNCILSPNFLDDVAAPAFGETINKLMDLWTLKAKIGQGVAFEATEDLRRAALEAMWIMLTGTPFGVIDASLEHLRTLDPSNIRSRNGKAVFPTPHFPEFFRALSTMLVCLDWVTQGVSPRGYRWIFQHTPWFRRADTFAGKTLQNEIDNARERLRTQNAPTCALDRVLKKATQSHSLSGAPTSDASLRDELLELLVTGHETTASSTGWALKYLADHPDVQAALHVELTAAFPSALTSPPSPRAIRYAHLPYLDAVIAETLRESATGPVSFRETVKDTEILGHVVPAGTPLILVTDGPSYRVANAWNVEEGERSASSRRREKHSRGWKEGGASLDHFKPERWLRGDGTFDAEAGPSLPFSTGPRGCFGKKLAMLELRLVIATCILTFELPRLEPWLSRYTAKDGLTRAPTCCFIGPVRREVAS